MKIGAIAAASITVAGSVLALSWACGSSTPTPTAPASPTRVVNVLQISGPASVAPGATAQLSATATFVDGSTGDVTAVARWNSSNPKVLSISTSGMATAITGGEVKVQAAYANRNSAFLNVRVVPEGTYRLAGTLTEAGLPVEGATVSVTAGQGTGLSTTSDIGGGYQLYGLAGIVVIQVTKAGYTPLSSTVLVAADAVAGFELAPINPEASIAGTYLLTVSAQSSCSSDLPPALMQRRYTAVITQADERPTVVVTLGGANFGTTGGLANRFSGRVEPDRVTFYLRGVDYYYGGVSPPFDLAEALDDGRFLIVQGSVSTTRTTSSLAGTLTGSISLTTDLTGFPRSIVFHCPGSHQVTFTRDPVSANGSRR